MEITTVCVFASLVGVAGFVLRARHAALAVAPVRRGFTRPSNGTGLSFVTGALGCDPRTSRTFRTDRSAVELPAGRPLS